MAKRESVDSELPWRRRVQRRPTLTYWARTRKERRWAMTGSAACQDDATRTGVENEAKSHTDVSTRNAVERRLQAPQQPGDPASTDTRARERGQRDDDRTGTARTNVTGPGSDTD